QLGIALHPAFRLEAGQAGHAVRDVVCAEDIGHTQINQRDATRQVQQRLRVLQIDIDIARVEFAHSQLEHSSYIDHDTGALSGLKAQLAAKSQTKVVCQKLADDGIAGRQPELPCNHVLFY